MSSFSASLRKRQSRA